MGAGISERCLEHSLGVSRERGLLCLSTRSPSYQGDGCRLVLGPMAYNALLSQSVDSPSAIQRLSMPCMEGASMHHNMYFVNLVDEAISASLMDQPPAKPLFK